MKEEDVSVIDYGFDEGGTLVFAIVRLSENTEHVLLQRLRLVDKLDYGELNPCYIWINNNLEVAY